MGSKNKTTIELDNVLNRIDNSDKQQIESIFGVLKEDMDG